jgi:hypothetical protein
MRFENWDVLLFPQVSGTPIQEFRTECFGVVTRTSNRVYVGQILTILSNRRVPNCQHVHPFIGLRHSLQDLAALMEQASFVVSQVRQRAPSCSSHARCHRWQDCCVSYLLPRQFITIDLLTDIHLESRESTQMATSLIRSSTRQSAARCFLPSTEPPCVVNSNFT